MRRNLVLEKMYEQGYITQTQFEEGTQQALPPPSDIQPPELDSRAPYFTSWLRQQLVERYGAAKDLLRRPEGEDDARSAACRNAAEEAVNCYLGYLPPTASVVVLDNKNAGVKAMVGGPNFETKPFNLATLGHRQPGSSIKPFTLITALEEGISPETVYESAPQEFHFGKHGQETFVVHNDEDSYLGSCSIICATTYSDNSIYAQLALEGLKGKTIEDRTRSIAATIHKMGYRDPISTNPAMVLGGLKEGVTPLGWAYAYMTIANNGDRVSGTLAPEPGDSPVAYTQVEDQDGHTIKDGDNDSTHEQVLSESTATEAKSILETVVTSGTGTHANIGASGQWGKTGTTEEQRRRLVLRRDRRSHRLRLGRLRRHGDADDDALQRRPGDGRHLPGADLGQRRLGLGKHQGRPRGGKRQREGGARRSGSSGGSAAKKKATLPSEPRPNRRNRKSANRRRNRKLAPEGRSGAEAAPEAAPESSGGGGGITAG